jgi:rhodanese-related sulfurtransferase
MANPITPAEIRQRLLARIETAFFDLREEAVFATGHPLFASQLPPQRIALEIAGRVPRKDCCIIVYDDGEGLTGGAIETLERLGYSDVRLLTGGLGAWRAAGYELFEDVNSYSKAFGELVEHRRHTPSLSAEEVQALID